MHERILSKNGGAPGVSSRGTMAEANRAHSQRRRNFFASMRCMASEPAI